MPRRALDRPDRKFLAHERVGRNPFNFEALLPMMSSVVGPSGGGYKAYYNGRHAPPSSLRRPSTSPILARPPASSALPRCPRPPSSISGKSIPSPRIVRRCTGRRTLRIRPIPRPSKIRHPDGRRQKTKQPQQAVPKAPAEVRARRPTSPQGVRLAPDARLLT